jgi:hypothetical protein
MAGKAEEVAPIMHKFMHKIAGDESNGALLGANEIDRNERQNNSEEEPRDNVPQRYWNWPGCRNLSEALHVLPNEKTSGSLSHDCDTVGAAAAAVNAAKVRAAAARFGRLAAKLGVC